MTVRIILFLVLLLNNLHAEFYYSGKINIPYNFNLNTYKNTKLPIRFIDLNLNYSFSNIDFKSNTAFEYNWNSNPHEKINFREYYLSYYPDFGEINIGKQIISWGFADGNNPTDNINPYDLNYMFESGTNRKIGIHSISSTIYYDNLKINFIASYDKFENNLNKQFPFEMPSKSNSEHVEYGLDCQYSMNQAELSISYFNGNDRFHNESIQAIGTNLLYLYNEFSFRFENAFFIANNNEKFLQGIIQIEYPGIFNFDIVSQLFGTYDFNAEKIYGIGSPLFILSEYMLAISSSRTFRDDSIEISNVLIYNLGKGHGYSLGCDVNYVLNDNIQSSINISKFFKGTENSLFDKLEDYSNLKISIKYFF